MKAYPLSAARKFVAMAVPVLMIGGGVFTASPAKAARSTPVSVVGLPPAATAGRGASVPFLEYEAEQAQTNGVKLGPDYSYTTLAAEASGRSAVSLNAAGQYVEFTLVKPANAVTVRYAVPDTADGKGGDYTLGVYTGSERIASVATTSRYSWYYGRYPFNNIAADGTPHHFFNESRLMLGRTLPAGERVRLMVGAGDAAPWYAVDLADFELVKAPLTKPAGSLSVNDFDADPTGVADSSTAFEAAIAQGKTDGKVVWIPQGIFKITRHIMVDKVTITGAGQWHAVVTGDNVGFFGKPREDGGSSNVRISGFAILGTVTIRNDSLPVNAIGGVLNDSVISDLWIQHSKVGAWIDGPTNNLKLSGLRILDLAADGVNFHYGVTNSTVENSFVRNTGDDALAMWSDKAVNTGNAFRHNTVVSPILANNIAIYGGKSNSATDNVVADTVTQGGGIHVGNRFGSTPLSGTTEIARNTTVRAGSMSLDWNTGLGALWFWAADAPITGKIAVTDMLMIDSAHEAIQTYGSSVSGLTVDRAFIYGAGTFALQLESSGSATFTNVLATRLGAGGSYDCNSGFDLTVGRGNRGWLDRTCGFPAAGPLVFSSDGLDFGRVPAFTSGTPQTVTITNPSNRTVPIESVVATGQFTMTTTCGTQLRRHESCTATIVFAPTGAGAHTGILTVSSGTSASQHLLPLTGDGISATGDAAEGRPVTASATGYGEPKVLTDGNAGSIWEGPKGVLPVSVTVDTQTSQNIGRAVLRLPDNEGWGIRTQSISVEGSTDGTTWSTLMAARPVTFDAVNAHNTATVTFPNASARYVRITFHSTTDVGGAAQLGEIELYATGVGPAANGDFAQGKPVTSGETAYGNPSDVTDSNRDTLWEGNLPASLTIDTQSTQSVGRVVLQLPACACWGVRTQGVDISASTDGVTWTPLVTGRSVVFDGPGANNSALVTFPATALRWVRVTIHSNTGGNAQLSEVHVYAPSDDLALGNPVTATATGYGNANSLTDGSAESLWEGPASTYPVSVTVDMQATYSVGRAVLQLPSCACWGVRTQDIDIEGSTDGTTWTSLLAQAPVTFDAPAAQNTATLTFAPAAVRYVRINVHSNTAAGNAQLSEVHLFAS